MRPRALVRRRDDASLPAVYACSGGSRLSRLAAETARRVEQLGWARRLSLESASGGDVGPRVVAIDGCALACGSRALEQKGVPPERVIRLDGLARERSGADDGPRSVEEVLAWIRPILREGAVASEEDGQQRAARRHYRGHSPGGYLEAIYRLSSGLGGGSSLTAAEVSRAIGVTRVSVGEMLDRLEAQGLVERGPHREVLLTEPGSAAAACMVRQRRIVESFLAQSLGYAVAELDAAAASLTEAFDDTMLERLFESLGRPERCPHGWPLDPDAEAAERGELVGLDAVGEGGGGVIAALTEDGGRIAGVCERGFALGAGVHVLRIEGAEITASLAGTLHLLDREHVACVFVRPFQVAP